MSDGPVLLGGPQGHGTASHKGIYVSLVFEQNHVPGMHWLPALHMCLIMADSLLCGMPVQLLSGSPSDVAGNRPLRECMGSKCSRVVKLQRSHAYI